MKLRPLLAVTVLASAVLTPATQAVAATPPPCVKHAMALPDVAGDAVLFASEPTGRFQAGAISTAPGHFPLVVVWDRGVPRTFTPDPQLPDHHVWLHAVNERGDVAGVLQRSNSWDAPFRYLDGKIDYLKSPAAGHVGSPIAINRYGEVLGEASTADGRHTGVVWTVYGTPRLLGIPSGYSEVEVKDLDRMGWVVGTAVKKDPVTKAVLATRAVYWAADSSEPQLIEPYTPGANSTGASVSWGVFLYEENGRGQFDNLDPWGEEYNWLPTSVHGPFNQVNRARSVVLGAPLENGNYRVYQEGVGERPLPFAKPTTHGGKILGFDDLNQAYGNDYGVPGPMRWDCS